MSQIELYQRKGPEFLVLFAQEKWVLPKTGDEPLDSALALMVGRWKYKEDVVRKCDVIVDGQYISVFISTHKKIDELGTYWEVGARTANPPGFNELPPLTLFFDERFDNDQRLSEKIGAFIEGAILGRYRFSKYQQEKDRVPPVQELRIISKIVLHKKKLGAILKRACSVSEAINWARDLGNEPSSVADPIWMVAEIRKRFHDSSVTVNVLNLREIKTLKMGGILAVSQGGNKDPRVVVLRYKPKKSKLHIGLVGKGVTFDSGGYCLKKYPGIETMKTDMCGAASIIAVMKALNELKPSVQVTAVIGLVENLISETAVKPGDIITMMKGNTVEVVNTDAEGRLVLGDLLVYLQKTKLDLLIDVATLTGNCTNSLGIRMTGAIGNDQSFLDSFIKIAHERTFERFWQLPLFKEYRERLNSPVADIQNVSKSSTAGAITAALFLSEFVKTEQPWLHLDIAGPSISEGHAAYMPKGVSGVPVKALLEFILNQGHL